MNLREQTPPEELANAITHGIGLGLAIAAQVVMMVFANQYGDIWHIVGYSIYGTTLILLYFSSTMYHSIAPGKWKDRFHLTDHISIFLLIAGTYTPITLIAMRDTAWGWTIFGIIWGAAILGIVLKVFWFDRFKLLSLILYGIMGWIIIIAIKPLIESVNTTGLIFLLVGGISYSLGIIFYVWRKIPFSHAIWHLFVLGGSISHFFTILSLLPK
jgi:hemolysin III